MIPAAFVLVFMPAWPLEPAIKQQHGFHLSCVAIQAMADGPVLVRCTVSYNGESPILLASSSWRSSAVRTTAPRAWQKREEPDVGRLHVVIGGRLVRPGGSFDVICYVHHSYDQIPAGPAHLTLTLPIYGHPEDSKVESKLIALLSADVELNVNKPSPAEVEAQVKAWNEALIAHREAAERKVLNEVLWTARLDFTPVIFRLMREHEFASTHNALCPFVYAWSRKSTDVHQRLIDYLRDSGGRSDGYFFARWGMDKATLSDPDVRTLLQAKDIWVRAWTCKCFPEKCGAEVEKLKKEIGELGKVPERH